MIRRTVQIQTKSPDETEALGKALAPFLPSSGVVGLYGNLAAGKTCFVHGFGTAFAIEESVSSPTFTIINEYHGSNTIFHLDLYRLNTVEELVDLGYEELFDAPVGICLIEWAERAGGVLPDAHVEIHFEHAGEDLRNITIHDHGVLKTGWAEELESSFTQVN